jgi:nicotinamide-nucleotide amidase
VPIAVLEQHGAVSRPVVEHMLQGALQRSGADMGVAVSGVAGPGGGTQDKPVGTVWIAWGSRNHCSAGRFQIPGDRLIFQTLTAAAAIDLVRRQLLGLPPQPKLLTRFQQP